MPSGVTATAVGYQPVGMKPLTWLRFGAVDVDDGDAVVVGVGDVERLAVGGDGQGVGRAAFGGLAGTGRCMIVSVTTPRARCRSPRRSCSRRRRRTGGRPWVHGELVGMLADGDLGDDAQVVRVDGQDGPAGPVGDVEPRAVAGDGHVIGPAADLGGPPGLPAGGVDGGERAGVDVERVERLAVGVEGQAAAEVARARRPSPWPSPWPSASGVGSGSPVAGQRRRPSGRRRGAVAAAARPPDLARPRRRGPGRTSSGGRSRLATTFLLARSTSDSSWALYPLVATRACLPSARGRMLAAGRSGRPARRPGEMVQPLGRRKPWSVGPRVAGLVLPLPVFGDEGPRARRGSPRARWPAAVRRRKHGVGPDEGSPRKDAYPDAAGPPRPSGCA